MSAWCDRCGGEFVDRAVCPDCGVALRDRPVASTIDEAAMVAAARRALADVQLGIVVLRVVAGVAMVVWVVGVIAAVVTMWEQTARGNGFGASPSRLSMTLATVLGSNSWGYLLVAVVAYGVSLALRYRDAADTIVALDDLGDLGGDEVSP